MKYIGIVLILLASILFGGFYSERLQAVSSELAEFVRFLRFMRERVVCYLEPAGRFARDFSSEELERCGFLPALRESGRLDTAYRAAEDRLTLREEDKALLADFFLHSGMEYLDSEVRSLDVTISKLESSLGGCEERCRTRGKSVKAISIAVGLGISILII